MKGAVIAIALLPSLFAQGPPPFPGLDGPKIPVSGRVLAAGDRPVNGARVVILTGPQSELGAATTDGAGRWTIAEVPAGEHRIMASKSGYVREAHRILIPAAGKLTGVDLPLERYAVLAGRVTDDQGKPVVGARVQSLSPLESDRRRSYGPTYAASGLVQTDDRGWFRLWGLSAGEHRLVVLPDSAPAAAGVIRLPAAPAFYPGVASVEEATPIDIDWGMVREGLDIRLPPPADTAVEAVMLLQGDPCSTCNLQVWAGGSARGLAVATGRRSPTGAFRVEGLPPGEYSFTTRSFDRTDRTPLQAVQAGSIRAGRVETIALEVATPAPLPVRVILVDPPDELLADGAQPWRVSLMQQPDRQQMQALMRTREMFANIQSTEREGTAEIATLPGRRELKIRAPEGSYVAAVTLGGQPLESLWLDAPPEGFQGEMVIRLAFDPGTVQGALGKAPAAAKAGLQPPAAAIVFEPEQDGGSLSSRELRPLQPDGSFSFSAAPGVYRVAVLKQQPGMQMSQQSFDSPELRERSKRVEVRAGETTTVTLDAPP